MEYSPSSKRIAWSVYCLIFTWSFEPGKKRLSMHGFWHMRFASVSATRIYKSGDRQPCQVPQVSFIGFEV